jgi:hypothetical protein
LDWDEVSSYIAGSRLHGLCFLTLDLARRACGAEIPDRVVEMLVLRTPVRIRSWVESRGLSSAAAMSMYRPDRSTIYYLHWHMAADRATRSRMLAFALRSAWTEKTGLSRLPAFLRRNAARLSAVVRGFAVK